MLGLAALSFVISRISLFIDMFESATRAKKDLPTKKSEQTSDVKEILPELPANPLENLDEAIEYYKLITVELGESFSLVELHQCLKMSSDPHPHLTIRTLREKGYLEGLGDGIYQWKNS